MDLKDLRQSARSQQQGSSQIQRVQNPGAWIASSDTCKSNSLERLWKIAGDLRQTQHTTQTLQSIQLSLNAAQVEAVDQLDN